MAFTTGSTVHERRRVEANYDEIITEVGVDSCCFVALVRRKKRRTEVHCQAIQNVDIESCDLDGGQDLPAVSQLNGVFWQSYLRILVDVAFLQRDNGVPFRGGLMKRSSGARKTAKLSELIHQQLNMYAIAASAAGVSLLASAQPAGAKIIYTPAHRVIPTGGVYNLDLNHDKETDFVLAHPSPSLNSSVSATSSVLAYPFKLGENGVYGRGNFASCLHKGARVGPGGRFSPVDRIMGRMHWFDGSYSVKGNWADGGKGVNSRYLGLRFKVDNETHYGWARLNVVISDSYPGISVTLTGYAYETIPGKSINAGQTHSTADDPTNEDFGSGAFLMSPIDTSRASSLGMLALGWQRAQLRRKERLRTPE